VCSTPQPGFFDVVGKYKWEAWKNLGDLDRTVAMQDYVESLLQKASEMPVSADLTRFVDSVTPVRRKAAVEVEAPVVEAASSVELNTSAVMDKAELIANQMDELREVVLQDSLKMARLQQSLEAGEGNEVSFVENCFFFLNI
jgi:hypothetical protein